MTLGYNSSSRQAMVPRMDWCHLTGGGVSGHEEEPGWDVRRRMWMWPLESLPPVVGAYQCPFREVRQLTQGQWSYGLEGEDTHVGLARREENVYPSLW